MSNVIPIRIAVEDPLGEEVIRVLLFRTGKNYSPAPAHGLRGSGYLKKRISGFNAAARGTPFVLLTDLDQTECPPSLINEWLPYPIHPNLIFRVAVREVESWILADQKGFSKFLGISSALMPVRPDEIDTPKEFLISIARKSRRRTIRDAIVPGAGSTTRTGPDYNGCLSKFVRNNWDITRAKMVSPSLNKTFLALKNFQPVYKDMT